MVTDATIDEDWRLDILVNNAGGTAPRLHLNATARRTGAPRDIAAAVVYLASPASSWVTGVPRVDGGTTAPAFTIPVPPLQSQAR
ncbi:putative 7-alpha-hydroxysteroid dehydrogenase [Mycobacterium xenopi 4042]|uniref:Putative 7-alpha-hydroxysteroid dehydrogenase n=1 Tax=Mycobacterium xenopi 4042 TaxID=1299334 RepID=X8AFK4_MYCXE|nr:putative 7-alpha-hydroxysteroid dehydrogenase [Mycobacterium xenopi 4042]